MSLTNDFKGVNSDGTQSSWKLRQSLDAFVLDLFPSVLATYPSNFRTEKWQALFMCLRMHRAYTKQNRPVDIWKKNFSAWQWPPKPTSNGTMLAMDLKCIRQFHEITESRTEAESFLRVWHGVKQTVTSHIKAALSSKCQGSNQDAEMTFHCSFFLRFTCLVSAAT